MDSIENEVTRDAEGNETTTWFLMKCPQFKHLNLCLNSIDDDIAPKVEEVLMSTPDDFGFTMSGNQLSFATVQRLHRQVTAQHKQRCLDARQND